MERKVIDLEIIDDLEGSGVDAIALVDSPAIEKNFMYFRAEQFVDPQAGESESDYMGRCISNNMGEGQSQEQAVAVCISKWEAHSAMEFAKVSFDYDDVLSTNAGLALAMRYRRNGDTLYIISAAPAISTDMMDRAFKLGIPRDRVIATGNNLAKVAKVRELKIARHIDNNADVVRSLSGIAQKFEINTGGLAPYTDQTGPLKRKAVEGQEFASEEYPTIEEAIERSNELGLKGEIHSHATDAGFIYMPGASHDDLEKALEGLEMAFAESYTDYPEAAVENARRAVAYAEENGWGDCGMATGKARASQLANKEPISEDTIARMASFERHRQNSNTPYGEGCGKLMWDAWGGDAGIEWAQRKLKQIRNEEFASVDELSVGDDVSWKTADQNPRGRITEIVKGAKKVPGVDFEIKGTEEDPGYIIEIYEEVDGKWEPTGKYVGRKADSILKNVKLAAVHNYSKMMFADEDKKEIVAIAMVPDMEIPRKDKNGNIYFVRFSKEVIAKIAEKYMREQRLAKNNIQHVDSADAGAYVFESWIVETADDKANSVYGLGAPVGAWCVKMRVTNLETWAKVKSGELKGLSIQGDFLDKDEYEAYMKDKKMYDELVKLVSTF